MLRSAALNLCAAHDDRITNAKAWTILPAETRWTMPPLGLSQFEPHPLAEIAGAEATKGVGGCPL